MLLNHYSWCGFVVSNCPLLANHSINPLLCKSNLPYIFFYSYLPCIILSSYCKVGQHHFFFFIKYAQVHAKFQKQIVNKSVRLKHAQKMFWCLELSVTNSEVLLGNVILIVALSPISQFFRISDKIVSNKLRTGMCHQ